MDYQETYDNMYELTDDLLQLLRKLQNVAGKKDLIIEISVKDMEVSVLKIRIRLWKLAIILLGITSIIIISNC